MAPGAAAWQGALPVPVPVPVPGPSQGWCSTARRPGTLLGCWVARLGSLWLPLRSLLAGPEAAPSLSLGMPAHRPNAPGQAVGSQGLRLSGSAVSPAQPRLGGQPCCTHLVPGPKIHGVGGAAGPRCPSPTPGPLCLCPISHPAPSTAVQRQGLITAENAFPVQEASAGGELSLPQPWGRGELAARDMLDWLLTKCGAKSARLFWRRREVCETFGRDLPAGRRVTTAARLGLFQETRGAGGASRTLDSAAGCSTAVA